MQHLNHVVTCLGPWLSSAHGAGRTTDLLHRLMLHYRLQPCQRVSFVLLHEVRRDASSLAGPAPAGCSEEAHMLMLEAGLREGFLPVAVESSLQLRQALRCVVGSVPELQAALDAAKLAEAEEEAAQVRVAEHAAAAVAQMAANKAGQEYAVFKSFATARDPAAQGLLQRQGQLRQRQLTALHMS